MTGVPQQVLAVTLALAGAASYAIAAVSQQRVAAQHKSANAFDPMLLVRLGRHRGWLLGLIAMGCGYGLQAVALGIGRLVVVEPIFPIGLLFALMLAARAEGRRMHRAEWTAAVATIVGLATFLTAAAPSAGKATAGLEPLGVVTGLTLLVAWICCSVAPRLATSHQALVLSVGSGVAAGTSGALTKSVVALVGTERFALFADIRLYLLILVGLLAFTLQQNAFRAAGLAASMPAASVLEPVVGAMLGVAIYGEQVSGGTIRIGVEVAAVLTAIWGIMRLARCVLEVCRRLAATAEPLAESVPVPVRVPVPVGVAVPGEAGAGEPLLPVGSAAPPRPQP